MNKHLKSKQQYEENYLNGPLNSTATNTNKNTIQATSKRIMNNQSQQNNYDDLIRHQPIGPHHKRVVSSNQMVQYQQQQPSIRPSTESLNYN